jgi:hypothetical protein
MLALLFAFAALVNGFKFGVKPYWLTHNPSNSSLKGLLASWIASIFLVSIVVLCPIVWFKRRRIELEFVADSDTLLIRSRHLFRTQTRRLGLADFSQVGRERIGRSLLNGSIRIVIGFSNGRTEPVAEVPPWGADTEANRIVEAIFAMARQVPQKPSALAIDLTNSCQGMEGEALIHELVVDRQKLSVDKFGPLDLSEIGRSIEADGVYFIWTCTCGDPGCGGSFLGVEVERAEGLIEWSDRDTHRHFTFRLEELRGAFEEAIAKGRAALEVKPQLIVVPDQNSVFFVIPP